MNPQKTFTFENFLPFPYQNPDKKVDKPINKEAFDTEGEHMQSTRILGERPLHGF